MMRSNMGQQISKAPWKKPAPKNNKPSKLTPAQKSSAKAAAAKAGRPYPSLVDNMNALNRARKK